MVRNIIQRFKRRHPEPTFTNTLVEIESFKQLVKASMCSGCGQLTVKVDSFERGPQGWQATVRCDNCGMRGIVNSTGFKFEGLEKDGKAKRSE